MSREVYVYRNGRLVPKAEAAPRECVAAHHVISDTMPAMRHPITQQVMDSKSAFRGVTRAHGCVEVGNEVQRDTRRVDLGDRRADIRRAIAELGGGCD